MRSGSEVEPFFYQAYGFANRETRRPNRTNTAFDIGSITKLLTRTAVAQLLQESQLDLALRRGKLLNPEWTAWVYRSDDVLEDATYAIGIAGGAQGVSTGFESDGAATAIVLSNFDPDTGEALARQLYGLIAEQ